MKTPYHFLILFIIFTLACSLTSAPVPAHAEVKNVNNVYLATPSRVPGPTPSTMPVTCTVSAQVLHLRACAGLHCTVIGWLSEGVVLTLQATDQDWLKVRTSTGQIGWVHSKYCGGRP